MSSLDAIKQYAAEEFEIEADAIDADAPFDKIGIDSLALVEFIFELEGRFDIRISADQAKSLKTLRELAVHIEKLLAEKNSCAESS